MSIEVEMRGPLPKDKHEHVEQFLKQNGKLKKSIKRLLIDYSDFLPDSNIRNRRLDVRARVTDGEPEMIIKLGKWGGTESRKQISSKLEKGEFLNLVETYAALGHTKGILCVRHKTIYTIDGIDFDIVEIPKHSLEFEAEIEVDSENDVKDAKQKISALCTKLGLSFYTDEQWYKRIEQLDKEANMVYDFENHGLEFLEEKFKEYI